MELTDFDFIRLKADTNLSAFSFCCGNEDLNEFFLKDSKIYLSIHYAMTYFFYSESDVVAFFSLSHDVLKHEKSLFDSNRLYKDFKRKELGISHTKYGLQTPAMKIGRLGVNSKYKGNTLGYQVIDLIKAYVLENRFGGCRLLTVDAYNEVTGFYEKNGFKKLLGEKKLKDTTPMYFDLGSI